jgi:hypothetical protein
MSIWTRDKVWVSADKQTYIEYDAGTATFSVVVDGTTVLTSTSSALAFAIAATPTGGIPAAGGFSASPRCVHTGGVPAAVSTDFTDATPAVTELYVAELFIPCNMTVTGIAVLLGSATEGNGKVALYDSTGARVAISASTDISGATVDAYLRVPFSTPYAAKGPATYYAGLIQDNTGNRFNAHTIGNFGAGKITGLVYATEAGYATITPPTTFTTALGPVATLY